ncbi:MULTISPECIES: CopD family protein [Streptomyces]|uniref:CopD family protein n=1 Tax=Streptomyces TaxID=1883 RepID=UPI0013163B23|nr:MULTISPECIES: CopD family protein [Streptomyces]QGZ51113.1 copper resistance protein CopD [Streptomyces sp. QHH-9511]GGU00258.1 membrane protein [Streptomyces lateritius]
MTPPGPAGAPIRRTAAVLAALAALTVALLGAGVAQTGTGELRIPAAGTTSVLRVFVLVALAVHLGELAGVRMAREGPLPRRWSPAAALAGAVASAGLLVLFAAVSGLSLATVYGIREGRLLLITANAFALASLCAASRRPALALVPLTGVVCAEALRAHPEAYAPAIGTGLTVVHLTAASLWFGGLLHVLRTMRLRGGGRDVLVRYARTAAWLFAALVITGTCSTLRRLPLDVVLTTAYGRVLLAKLALFGLVSLLALTARHRMLRGGDARAPARIELGVLAAIVVVSALLTVVPDPHWLSP